MPDLGKYAAEVMAAYAASIVLIVGFVVATLRKSAQVRRALEAREAERQER